MPPCCPLREEGQRPHRGGSSPRTPEAQAGPALLESPGTTPCCAAALSHLQVPAPAATPLHSSPLCSPVPLGQHPQPSVLCLQSQALWGHLSPQSHAPLTLGQAMLSLTVSSVPSLRPSCQQHFPRSPDHHARPWAWGPLSGRWLCVRPTAATLAAQAPAGLSGHHLTGKPAPDGTLRPSCPSLNHL